MNKAQRHINTTEAIASYLATVVLSAPDEGDEWHISEFARETIQHIETDVRAFMLALNDQGYNYLDKPSSELGLMGYHLYHNRVGAGVGFWDGGWQEDIGEVASDLAKELGHVDYYKGDDGLIYHI